LSSPSQDGWQPSPLGFKKPEKYPGACRFAVRIELDYIKWKWLALRRDSAIFSLPSSTSSFLSGLQVSFQQGSVFSHVNHIYTMLGRYDKFLSSLWGSLSMCEICAWMQNWQIY
jgi:hypothetical protein